MCWPDRAILWEPRLLPRRCGSDYSMEPLSSWTGSSRLRKRRVRHRSILVSAACCGFTARVAECEVGRSRVAIRVKSLVSLLAMQQMPRRLYQASCNHVFGDAMCGYDRVLGKSAAGVLTGYRGDDGRGTGRVNPGADRH